MARQLTNNYEIDNFIKHVIAQAQHHAPDVVSVISLLEIEIRKRLILGVDKLEVYERNGVIARTCWVTLGGKRYVFTYNYDTYKIDLKTKSLQGGLIYSFNNSTTIGTVQVQISHL